MTQQLISSGTRKYRIALVVLCIGMMTASTSQAATLYWNAPTGGAGNWDIVSTKWATNPAGPLNTIWSNTALYDAVFQNSGGAVAVDAGGITVHNIDFNVTGYSLSGGTITLGGTNPTITVANAGDSASIDSDITPGGSFSVAGAGNLTLGHIYRSGSPTATLTKSGTGTLTLGGSTGGDNTWLAAVINGGTLMLSKLDGKAVDNLTVNTGATAKVGVLSTSTGTGQINNSSTVTLSGGTLDLNGFGPESATIGASTVNGEVIGVLSDGGVSTGTVTNTSASTTTTLIVGGSGTGTYSGLIADGAGGTGVVAVARTGSGTLTLSGANSYSGGTYISGGRLNINDANAIGTGTLTISGGTIGNTKGSDVTLATNNPQTWAGTFTYAGPNNLNLGTGAVNISAATLNVQIAAGTTLTVGGPVTYAGSGITIGAGRGNDGTLALLAASPAYTGATNLNRGTLAAGNATALGISTLNLNGGSLQAATPLTGANKLMNNMLLNNSAQNPPTGNNTTISGSNAIEFGGTLTNNTGNRTLFVYNSGGTTFSGNVYLSEVTGTGRTLTINASGPTTISGTIANFSGGAGTAGNLQVTGNNTLTLSGANTFTGTTTLFGATTVLDYSTNDNNKIASGANLNITGGAGIRLKGGSFAQNVNATILNGGGALNVSRDAINPGTATMVLKAITRNTGSALNAATGTATTTTLNGANNIMGGAFTVDGTDWAVSGATAGTYPIAALAAGSYQTGPDSTPWAATDNVAIIGNTALSASREIYTLRVGTTATGQALNIGAGQTLQLDSGGLLLTGANDYTINNGTLQGSTAANSELIVHQWMGGAATINSVIANRNGNSILTKVGSGTLILGANNTYTGTTYVAAGTLKLGVANAINTTNTVQISGGGVFDLAGHSQTLGSTSYNTAGIAITNNSVGTAEVTSSLPGGVLTLNTNDNGGNSNILYTGQLAIVVRDPGSSNNFQLANPFNSFSGGLTAQGNGAFTVDKLTTTGVPVVKGGIAISAVGTGGASTQVRINNQASGTGALIIDNGVIWTPSQTQYVLNNPIVVTANGGALFTDINDTVYSGPITSVSGTPLLVIGGDTSSRPREILSGSMSGFSGTFAVDSANSTVDLSGNALGSPTANLLFFGNSTSNGIVSWNGAATPTTIQFAELMNGAVTVNGVSATFGTNIGVLDSKVNTTVTYQIGDNTTNVPNFGGIIRNSSGTVAVTKIGSNTQILSGANTYAGATTVSGGTLQLTNSSNSTTFTVNGGSLVFNNTTTPMINAASATGSITNGSMVTNATLTNFSLNVNGGGTFATALTLSSNSIDVGSGTTGGVVVAGGSTASAQGTISMIDNIVGTITLHSPSGTPALTLGGAAGTDYSVLNLELLSGGADRIMIDPSSTFLVNPGMARVNISGSGFDSGTYPIITFASGAKSGPNFTSANLGSTPGGLFNYSLNTTATEVDLVVTGNPVPYDAYWKGTVDTVWKDYSGSGPTATTNWVDGTGTDTHQLPGGVTTVHFAAAGSGSGPINSTLGQNFTISGLRFESSVGPSRPVTIGGSNTLIIGSGGITIDSGSGAHTISTAGLTLTGSQSWTNNSSSPFTVSAPLSGDSLTFLSITNGLFVISGSGSTFSGYTNIGFGSTVRIGSASALGTSQLTVDGTLDLNGITFTAGGLSGSGIVTNSNASGATLDFAGAGGFGGTIQNGAGTVAVKKSGTGLALLSGANSYTGGTTLNGGTLQVGHASALGAAGNITFTGGTIQYGAGVVADQSARIKNSTSAIMVDASTQDVAWGAAIDSSNTGGLRLSAGGTLTLSGNNSYTGVNAIAGGTLKLGSSTALGNAANNIDIAVAGSLDLNGQTITGGSVSLGGMTNSSIITNSNTSTPAVFNADIVGYAGGLTLTSPGDIAFKLIDQAIGDATGRLLTWNSPATLTLGTNLSTAHNRMLRLVVNQGTVLFNMPLAGTTNCICVDRSLTINDGLAKITGSSNNQLQDDYAVTFGTSGAPTLDLNGHSETVGGVQGGSGAAVIQNTAVGTTATLTLNTIDSARVTLPMTFDGVIRDNSGTGGIVAITKTAADYPQTFTSVNTYTGPTNINQGTLALISAGSIANSSAINIAAAGVFDVSGTAGVYGTGVGQTISGGGTIVGSYTHGQGTIVPGAAGTAGTLTFDNTVTGGTATISGGAINFDVSSSTGSGNDLIVFSGGNGSLSGNVTVNVSTALGYVLSGTYTVVSQPSGAFTPAIGGWTATWDRRGANPTLATTGNSVTVTLPAAVGPAANLKWSGTTSAAWDIVTTPNWYNSAIPGMDKYYRGDNVAFSDTYNGVNAPLTTAVALNTSVSPAAVTFDANSLSYTISGAGTITGATSIVKDGAGAVTISTANSYTGGTTISGGILSISADNNLGATGSMTTLNKTGVSQAVLQAAANLTLGNRPITVGAGGGAIDVPAGISLTWAPTATGTGNSAFNGPLSIQGGGTFNLNLGATGSFIQTVGPGASLAIAPATTLNVGGTDPFTNGSTHMPVANSGILNIASGSKQAGAVTGTGSTTLAAGTSLTVALIAQDSLTLGAGATLTISPLPGGPIAGGGALTAVPEPSTWIMLMLAAMGLAIYWRRGW